MIFFKYLKELFFLKNIKAKVKNFYYQSTKFFKKNSELCVLHTFWDIT
jgi:hypothetical protein